MEDEVNQVVIHELIHAYDECRAADLDWSNCAHRACSEVELVNIWFRCMVSGYLLRSCWICIVYGADSCCTSQWWLQFQTGVAAWFCEEDERSWASKMFLFEVFCNVVALICPIFVYFSTIETRYATWLCVFAKLDMNEYGWFGILTMFVFICSVRMNLALHVVIIWIISIDCSYQSLF